MYYTACLLACLFAVQQIPSVSLPCFDSDRQFVASKRNKQNRLLAPAPLVALTLTYVLTSSEPPVVGVVEKEPKRRMKKVLNSD
jgi:hypothetical protein